MVIRVVTTNHAAESIFIYLRVLCANNICSEFFNLASNAFLGQRQNAATLFAKLSQEKISSPLANILPLSNPLSEVSKVHIVLCTAVSQAPLRLACQALLTTIQLLS